MDEVLHLALLPPAQGIADFAADEVTAETTAPRAATQTPTPAV
jgi:hypothetical protein